MKRATCTIGVLLLATTVVAQQPTLRELIAELHSDVALTVNVDGPPRVFADLLRATDRVVRAKIGNAVGRLTEDESDIVTTYELTGPQMLFSAKPPGLVRPGPSTEAFAFTQQGGTVLIDGFKATVRYDDTPKLTFGMDLVLLLKADKDTYRVVGQEGMFEVRESLIVPVGHGPGEHRSFAGMNVEKFVAEIVARRQGTAAR
jgi:hypothetical protein